MAVTLRDFISGDEVLTIESNATLGAAARQMWNRSVGAAVVVEEDEIVGIFTERDLLRAIADCVVPHSTASSCWDMPRARRVSATSRPTSANRRS